MVGRRPKPTAIKELAGNPGKRPLNKREPKPRVMTPTCPTWLKGEGRKEYRRQAKLLAQLRVLTEADRMALAAYAREYQLWREADVLMEATGPVITSEKGNIYQSPWVGIANTHLKNMSKLMGEFGMTPASRTRISAEPPDNDSMTVAEQLFASVSIADD